MFIKIINNTPSDYPYNPQADHPLTSFPQGASYPDFNCYWVFSTAPNNPDPELYDAVEGSPVFNEPDSRWEQSWEFVEKPEEPPVADWDGFNAAILSNVEFNQATGAVLQVAPSLALALPAALAQVASNGVNAFALVFNPFCAVGQVSSEQRGIWADMAVSHNLPADFVAVVRV